MIIINEQITIQEDELRFTASLSSGPGGQNVNKLNTRITLLFDVVNSPSLSQDQKELISRRLANRIGRDGVLHISSQQTRSQTANRELAVERFIELMQDALKQVPIRKKTRVSRGAKLRRLEEKKQRSVLKNRRSERTFPLD